MTGITDSVGNTLLSGVTVVYGIKPFVTAAVDADRGAWLFSTDSLGERYGWTDANGKSFAVSYDAQSRPLTRTEQDMFTEWNYGTAAPNVGQLTSECTAAASTTNLCTTTGSSWLYKDILTYDTFARLYQRSITQSGNTAGNDGAGAFLYTYKYAPPSGPWGGQLYSLTYPTSTSGSALTLQYNYAYGLLSTVTDSTDTTGTCGSTCVLWTANTTNGFGEVTKETLGNGVVTNRSYDAVTSWLTGATAGVGGGTALLNQSYTQDMNGNVMQRQAVVQGTSLTENFYYDADNRLCAAVLNGTGACTSPTVVYDATGNITNQIGVGAYTYPTAGQPRPHAVSSISGTYNGPFSYDNNGNMTARMSTSQNIFWFTSNYPSSISTSTEEVQFQYGPDRQRWQQIYTGPGGNETTYYVGNGVLPAPAQMEVVFVSGVPTYRHYIYAGSEPVAVYSRSSAGNTMSYVLEDHQRGVAAVTSSTGATDVNDSFSAFGQLRNSLTWSGAPTSAELGALPAYTRQGDTFQTWLGQSMGLNHMNGRVEDAILGRMLSPDPIIQDSANAQNYNRYSYVLDNPLTSTDLSGFLEDDGNPLPIDLGPPPPLPPIAAEPNYFTGSSIANVAPIGEASCSGNCAAFYAYSDPTYFMQSVTQVSNSSNGGGSPNGVLAQVPYAGSEHVSNVNVDGSMTSLDPDEGFTGNGLQVTAPGYHWVWADGFNYASFASSKFIYYNPALAAAQVLAIGAVGGGGAAAGGMYAAIGAGAGAFGAGKSSHWNPVTTAYGAALGSLTGGLGAWATADLSGLGAAFATSLSGGAAGAGSTLTMNALTGKPLMQDVVYAGSLGAIAPFATGEALIAGAAGFGGETALGYGLNAASSAFATGLGP